MPPEKTGDKKAEASVPEAATPHTAKHVDADTPAPPAASMSAVPVGLNSLFPLSAVRDLPGQLSNEDKFALVSQLIALVDHFYVHLPLKRSMLAIDPIQNARLLLTQLGDYRNDIDFLQDFVGVFTSLRDLHTNFVLPAPWQGMVAFLPFLIEGFRDENGFPRYLVTKISPYVDLGKDFVPGVEVTHWNGTPMPYHVLDVAATQAGANPEAQRRRALSTLTTRTLSYQMPPHEDWARLSYIGAKGPAQIESPWLVSGNPPAPGALETTRITSPHATAVGLDALSRDIQRLRERLFAPIGSSRANQAMGAAQGVGAPRSGEDGVTSFPQNLSYGTVDTPSGTLGYIRIWNFEIDDVDGFQKEVRRILGEMPRRGLILDVRSNPGGTIPAGERILQYLTSKTIRPEPVSFRATDFNRIMCGSIPELEPWRDSLDLAIRTGELFSQGVPLTTAEQANDTGRVYGGPTVVIIDAMCYSTCDFFVSGFQDHQIGPILGVDKRTGAGGANVWTHDLLQQIWQNSQLNPLQPLPNGASMRVALRRSTRVAKLDGIPVEGLGTKADVLHSYTRNDILNRNCDLYAHAAGLIVK